MSASPNPTFFRWLISGDHDVTPARPPSAASTAAALHTITVPRESRIRTHASSVKALRSSSCGSV